MDPFTISALVSVGMNIVGNLIGGFAQNSADRKTKENYELQLDQLKRGYAQNALDSASYNTQRNYADAQMLTSQIEGFNSQLDMYTQQAMQSNGSVRSASAMTGFRNNGANANAVNMQQKSGVFNISYLKNQLNANALSTGYSAMGTQNQYMSAMEGFKLNVGNAVQNTGKQISDLGVANNYFFSKRMLGDVGTAFLNTGMGITSKWFSNELSNRLNSYEEQKKNSLALDYETALAKSKLDYLEKSNIISNAFNLKTLNI